jgi:hypothetical protein
MFKENAVGVKLWRFTKGLKVFPYVITAILVAFFYLAGPKIEEKFFPILDNIRVTDVTREGDVDANPEVCFNIAFHKARYAVSSYAVFLAETPSGDKYDTRVSTGSSSNVGMKPFKTRDGVEQRKAGSSGTYHWCASLPQNMEGLTLTGKIVYETWHHQWVIEQELPTISIPDTNDRQTR